MYDERFYRMCEFYLVSTAMTFRTGCQPVFHMQLARKRDTAPIVRDYITDLQCRYGDVKTRAAVASAGPVDRGLAAAADDLAEARVAAEGVAPHVP
jgi:hypothetical protein